MSFFNECGTNHPMVKVFRHDGCSPKTASATIRLNIAELARSALASYSPTRRRRATGRFAATTRYAPGRPFGPASVTPRSRGGAGLF